MVAVMAASLVQYLADRWVDEKALLMAARLAVLWGCWTAEWMVDSTAACWALMMVAWKAVASAVVMVGR